MSRQVKKVNISGKEDKSNKVISWSSTTTDTHYPSEKLVKDSLDGKASSTHNHTKSQITDFPSLSTVATTGSYSDLSNKPTIPSASSTTPSADTTNGSVGTGTTYAKADHTHPKSSLYAEATHTHSQYLTEHQDLSDYVTTDDSRLSDARTPTSHTHTKSQITDFPTIPSASSTVPSADTTNGSYGSGTSYARSNHIHPKSSLYAEASHTHSQYLTSHQDISGKEDITNKVTQLGVPSDDNDSYPTAKAVLDEINSTNNDLDSLRGSLGAVAFSNEYTDLDNLPQLGAVALSNDYDDLDNLPTIPTPITVNSLDSGFTTSTMQTANLFASANGSDLMQYHFNQSVNADIGDLWDSISNMELQSNKVNSWSSTPTDTHYPSEKLVKEYVDGLVGSAITYIVGSGN